MSPYKSVSWWSTSLKTRCILCPSCQPTMTYKHGLRLPSRHNLQIYKGRWETQMLPIIKINICSFTFVIKKKKDLRYNSTTTKPHPSTKLPIHTQKPNLKPHLTIPLKPCISHPAPPASSPSPHSSYTPPPPRPPSMPPPPSSPSVATSSRTHQAIWRATTWKHGMIALRWRRAKMDSAVFSWAVRLRRMAAWRLRTRFRTPCENKGVQARLTQIYCEGNPRGKFC